METETTFVPNRRQYDRLMLKHNDNERALQILRQRQEKRQAMQKIFAQAEQDYQPMLEILSQAGFPKVKCNIRLLIRSEGQLDPVLTVLLKRQEKRLARDFKRKSCLDNNDKFEKKRICREHKFALKAQKHEQKLLHKEEKREKREKPHHRRAARGEANEEKQVDPPVEWNNVQHLFLDGNNMLFVPPQLRNLVLKRKSRAAERILAELARAFALKCGLPKTTLLFDNTPLREENESFLLKSSRPEFATSDDELVLFAQQNQGEQCVFVTSDRELRERLTACGVGLMKPGRWFAAVSELLGEQEYGEILGRQFDN